MKRQLMSIKVPNEIYHKLKLQSELELMSMTALIVKVLKKYFEDKEVK